MNISSSPSQFNSGCDSGWTHYLDQSYLSESHEMQKGDDCVGTKPEFDEEEEEDLSMVSDASSGPPHYHELDEDGCSFSVNSWSSKLGNKSNKKKKKKSKESNGREQHPLDDTASSSVLNYYSKKKLSTISKDEPSMQNVLDYSDGFSATHVKGKSALLKHFGFLNSTLASQKPGDFQEGRWE